MSEERPDATPSETVGSSPATGPAQQPLWRRPVVVVSAVVVVLAALVGTVLWSQANAQQAKEDAIRSTASGYLEAIAKGDADAALQRLSQQPANRDLLTDEVLKASMEAAPITDIAVTGFEARPDSATVAVTYKLGSESVSTDVDLVGDGRTNWKLASGLSELQVTNLKGLTVNGATVGQTVSPVFPGTYTAKPAIEQIALDGPTTVTIPAPNTPAATLEVTPKLSDTGIAQAREAAKAAFDTCLASKETAPPGCPWRMDDSDVQITPDSVRYTAKNDPWAEFTPALDVATMTAKGTAHYAFDASAHITMPDRSGEVSILIERDTPVTLDLTTQPMRVTWS